MTPLEQKARRLSAAMFKDTIEIIGPPLDVEEVWEAYRALWHHLQHIERQRNLRDRRNARKAKP